MEGNKWVDKQQGRSQDFFPKIKHDFLNPPYLFICLFVTLFIHSFIYLLIYFFLPWKVAGMRVRTVRAGSYAFLCKVILNQKKIVKLTFEALGGPLWQSIDCRLYDIWSLFNWRSNTIGRNIARENETKLVNEKRFHDVLA